MRWISNIAEWLGDEQRGNCEPVPDGQVDSGRLPDWLGHCASWRASARGDLWSGRAEDFETCSNLPIMMQVTCTLYRACFPFVKQRAVKQRAVLQWMAYGLELCRRSRDTLIGSTALGPAAINQTTRVAGHGHGIEHLASCLQILEHHGDGDFLRCCSTAWPVAERGFLFDFVPWDAGSMPQVYH